MSAKPSKALFLLPALALLAALIAVATSVQAVPAAEQGITCSCSP